MRTPEAAGLAINVSSGRRLEIGELAGRIGAALGSSIRPAMTGEFRVGDIRHCFADTARAERVLAFRPAVDLDVGIAALAEWVARQTVDESGDRAVAALRGLGLVG
ncbi:MAG: hypothetical protein NVS2B6_20580 [Thermoleophilaceae bacterium]